MADQTNIIISADASGVKQGVQEAKDSLQGLGTAAQKAGNAGADGVAKVGKASEETARKVERSSKAMERSMQRDIALKEAGTRASRQYYEALISQRGLDASRFEPMLKQFDAMNTKMKAGAISVEQYNNAMRMLPVQITDVVTQLAGGQNPALIAIQQGGQIRDSFGSVKESLRGVMSVITPFRVAVGAGVGSVLMLGKAMYDGAEESRDYQNAIALAGDGVGITASRLQYLAISVGASTGYYDKSREAAMALVETGKVATADLGMVTQSLVYQSEATGKSVQELAADYAKLADDPVKAVVELSSKYRIMTQDVYDQVKALKEQGKEQEAVRLVQKLYAEESERVSKQVVENIGWIEQAWNGAKKAAAGAWDYMKSIGRDSSIEEQLAELDIKIAKAEQYKNRTTDSRQYLAELQAQKAVLESVRQGNDLFADGMKKAADENNEALEARTRLEKQAEDSASNQVKLNKKLAEIEEDRVAALKTANAEQAKLINKQAEAAKAGAREQYKEKSSSSRSNVVAKTRADLQALAQDPNVRKMLQVIGYTEGTDVRHGYNTLVGGRRIDDLSRHPNVVGIRTKDGPSTAFGRYQIVNTTWKGLQKQWGFSDFSKSTQDQAAVALLQSRGALNDVLKGDFGKAINKLGTEWVSLPSSKNKNQGKRSWAEVNKILGSSVDGDARDYAVDEQERRVQKSEQLQYSLASREQKALIDHQKTLSDIKENAAEADQKALIDAENARYEEVTKGFEREKQQAELANQQRLYGYQKYLMTREEQLKAEADFALKQVELDDKLLPDDKLAMRAAIISQAMDEIQRPYLEFIHQVDAVKAFREEVEMLNKALAAGDISQKEFDRRIKSTESRKPDVLKTDFQKEWSSVDGWIQDAMDVQTRLDQGIAGWLQSSADALAEFVTTGKLNFSDLANSIIQDLAKIALQQGLARIATGIIGMFGSTGSTATYTGATDTATLRGIFGYDKGGFTGHGGKYEPAGVVHKGEGVLNQEEIGAIGGESGFNQLRRNIALLPRHSNGGMAGRPTLPASVLNGQAKSGMNVVINNNAPVEIETRESTDANGAPVLDIFVQKVVSEVNKQIATNGSTGKIMQSVFGVQRKPR